MSFSDVNYNPTGTNDWCIQIGSGGAYITTGYSGTSSVPTVRGSTNSSGLIVIGGTAAALMSGSAVFTRVSGNNWAATAMIAWANGTTYISFSGTTVTLPAALDSIRLTTVNGTDVFTGGTVNILYE
jgi:hypothetical protein